MRALFSELKQAALRPDRSEFLDLVRAVFRLKEEPPDTPAMAN